MLVPANPGHLYLHQEIVNLVTINSHFHVILYMSIRIMHVFVSRCAFPSYYKSLFTRSYASQSSEGGMEKVNCMPGTRDMGNHDHDIRRYLCT